MTWQDNEGGIAMDIFGCARCGGDGHEGLRFLPFKNPILPTGDVVWSKESGRGFSDPLFTHWATCPETGEPILLTFQIRIGE